MENTFPNEQTVLSICSVLLVVLQSLIWQHAALIWLSMHTTTKAPNTWAQSAEPETECDRLKDTQETERQEATRKRQLGR